MATATLQNASLRFPSGTSVKAYPETQRGAGGGAPTGTATETATVATNGTLTFSSLTAGTNYVAYALVSGEHRYLSFSAPPSSGFDPGSYWATDAEVESAAAAVPQLLGGLAAPDDSLGSDDDHYLQRSVDDLSVVLYGPKTAGAWGRGVTISGTRYDNAGSLFGTPAQLDSFATAFASHGSQVVRVNAYGDSLTEGFYADEPNYANGWVGRLRSMLEQAYGRQGTGVVPIYKASQSEVDERLTFTGTWTDYALGCMANACRYATGATNTAAFGPVYCDSFTAYYATGGSGGTFNINVDGGTNTPVNSSGSVGYAKTTIATTAGLHTLNVIAPASNNVFLVGVEATIGTTGIRVSRLGVGGAASASFGNASANNADGSNSFQFDQVHPDLSIIAMGLNDFLQQIALNTHESQMQVAITKAMGYGDVLLVAEPPPNDPGVIPYSDYVSKMYALASANGLPLLDLTLRWQSFAVSDAAPYEYYEDTHHPNSRGHFDMAKAVYDVLTAAVSS